ncbi:hypothetical protein ACW9HR_22140 [Nocardia gipuzkoensis]
MIDRVRQQEFTAYAATGSLGAVWSRIERLLAPQRPIVYVEHWLTGTAITVLTGLSLDDSGIWPGARYWHDDSGEGFAVALSSGVGLGTSAHSHEGSESDAAHRFLTDRRSATCIHLRGFGHSREDHLHITTYNKRGVGVYRALHFHHAATLQHGASLEQLTGAR